MRRLARHAEDLVDELVRHLVLEHAEHFEPRPLEDQGSRELEQARRPRPLAQAPRRVCQHEYGWLQLARKPALVRTLVRPAQLAHERRLQLGRQHRFQAYHADPTWSATTEAVTAARSDSASISQTTSARSSSATARSARRRASCI